MPRSNPLFSGSRFLLKAVAFTVVLCALWLFFNLGTLRELLDTNAQRKQEQDQIEVLRKRIENLKGQQRSLLAGGIETERQVRERFRMHKPGERVIFLEPDNEDTTSSRAGSAATSDTASATRPAPANPAALFPEETPPSAAGARQTGASDRRTRRARPAREATPTPRPR
jgi:cell division protein FtsB